MLTPQFEFGRWETPFENTSVELVEVSYKRGKAEARSDVIPDLVIRLYCEEINSFYSISFAWVGAYRVLDEHGLSELWEQTDKLGGRPGNTTFRVRHHLWSKESELSFFNFSHEGWSYVVATDFDCIEIVSKAEPKIVVET